MAVTEQDVMSALKSCYDPEIPVNIVDLGLIYLMRREELAQVKFRKTAIGDPRGKKLPQAARFDGAQRTNFFEDNAPQWIVKNSGIEQPANFQACAGLEQHRAEEPQRVSLQLQSPG